MNYHWVQEAVGDGFVDMRRVPTADNTSDVFTKTLGETDIHVLRLALLRGQCFSAAVVVVILFGLLAPAALAALATPAQAESICSMCARGPRIKSR
jgi:hypothetical protein